MNDVLLDTCAVLWIGHDRPLLQSAENVLNQCRPGERRALMSPFSVWELGSLVAKGRLRLSAPVINWFEGFRQRSGADIADLSPQILAASSFLPGQPPADPANRVLIATARAMDLILITRDQAILDYGQEGWVRTLAC